MVEFRVSLEKKKTDGKVFVVHKKCSRDSAFTKIPSHSTLRKLLQLAELVPDFPAAFSPWLEVERRLVRFARLKCTIITL